MTFCRFSIIALLCLGTLNSPLPAADDAGDGTKTPQQLLDEIWPGLVADDEGSRRGPEQQWQEFCTQAGAPGHEAERAAACRAMAEKLVPETPVYARVWLLKQLQFIGRAESVDAVAAQLDHADPLVHDAARRALAHNPAPEAGGVLRKRLQTASDAAKEAALVNALGFRAEEASVAALAEQLRSSDEQVASAAARALGAIATPAAAQSLATARKAARGETRRQISDAYLRCADRMAEAGQRAEAAAIYKELNTPDEPARLAALKGVLRTAGDSAGAIVLDALGSDDRAAHRVAIHHVDELSSGGIRMLAAGWSKLPADGQMLLLAALGTRGDEAGLPAVLAALDSSEENVRIVAIRALGGVGNASAAARLIEIMQSGGDAGNAAREALGTTWAEGVDAELVKATRQAEDPGQRAQLIEILDRRRAAIAVPALLQEMLHEDSNVRRRAMSALGNLAGAGDIDGMLKGLIRLQDAGERDEAEKAITAVCSRIADESQQVEVILTVYKRSPADDKSIILPVLGRIGGEMALQTVRAAISGSDAGQHDSGVRALCNWPDSAVAEDLLKLAETDREESNRVRALRALARVAVLPGERTEENKLQLLKDGMRLATRDDERKLILDRAREARTVETARFAASFLDNPALAERACRTIIEVAHRREIREPNQDEFNKLLAEVVQVTKDRGLADRARGYMTQN